MMAAVSNYIYHLRKEVIPALVRPLSPPHPGSCGFSVCAGSYSACISVLLQTMASPDTDEATEVAQETHMGGQLSCVTLDPVSPTLSHSDAALKNFCWALSNLALPIGNAPL